MKANRAKSGFRHASLAKWNEYHRRCDEWTAKHGYGDERAFLDFVRRLTAELGL